MYKVFMSYSTDDFSLVERVRKAITNDEVETFVAEYSVPPGTRLNDSIVRAINECDLFVLLWSRNSKASEYVSQEIGVARGVGKRIMPLVLEKGLKLPGLITDLKYLPVYRSPEESLEWLRENILGHVEERRRLEEEKQRRKDALVLFGIGALILLFLSQK